MTCILEEKPQLEHTRWRRGGQVLRVQRNGTKSSLISIAYLLISVNREIDLLTKNVSFEVPTQTGNYRMPKIGNKPRHLNQ